MKNKQKSFVRRFKILIYFIAALWIVEAVNLLLGHSLCAWGILPRTARGLVGVPLAPFLHSGPAHLAMNTVPLAVLGGLIIFFGKRAFAETTLFIILAGGAALWLIGRAAPHVGASGLIFGYFGYLVARGFFKKDIISLIVAFITFFAYGGLLWGLAPTSSHISWERHLCGFAAGILAAGIEKKPVKKN